jgi:site-specific recombinase XerD
MPTKTLDELFKLFLQERRYLLNVTPRTVDWYELSWLTFKRLSTHSLTVPTDLTREDLEHFVYMARDRGMKPITVNSRVRALNAFFRWLHARGATGTQIRLKPPRFEKRLIATLDEGSIRTLVSFKPKLGGRSTRKRWNAHIGQPTSSRPWLRWLWIAYLVSCSSS